MNKNEQEKQSVAVVGAGPAGLMAAIQALRHGYAVTVYERNEKAGKKLYITGKGRCNLCNDCPPDEVLKNVVRNSKFLYSAVYRFAPEDTIAFFENAGLPLVTTRGNRVFPKSDKASDVTKTLVSQLTVLGGQLRVNSDVSDIKRDGDGFLMTVNGEKLHADFIVLACGGKSYPSTGSTGQGYVLAQKLGHTLVSPRPALVPFVLDAFPETLAGLSLKNVTVSVDGDKKHNVFGEMLFTHTGASGPAVLTLSSFLATEDVSGRALIIDLKPALNAQQLDNRLLREIDAAPNKQCAGLLQALMPKALTAYVCRAAHLNETEKAGALTREKREQLIAAIKGLRFPIRAIGGFAEAVVTAGGVPTGEINPKTMESRITPGLFFAGEMIDVDALTGGFNIQIALSTGYAAGQIETARKNAQKE